MHNDVACGNTIMEGEAKGRGKEKQQQEELILEMKMKKVMKLYTKGYRLPFYDISSCAEAQQTTNTSRHRQTHDVTPHIMDAGHGSYSLYVSYSNYVM